MKKIIVSFFFLLLLIQTYVLKAEDATSDPSLSIIPVVVTSVNGHQLKLRGLLSKVEQVISAHVVKNTAESTAKRFRELYSLIPKDVFEQMASIPQVSYDYLLVEHLPDVVGRGEPPIKRKIGDESYWPWTYEQKDIWHEKFFKAEKILLKLRAILSRSNDQQNILKLAEVEQNLGILYGYTYGINIPKLKYYKKNKSPVDMAINSFTKSMELFEMVLGSEHEKTIYARFLLGKHARFAARFYENRGTYNLDWTKVPPSDLFYQYNILMNKELTHVLQITGQSFASSKSISPNTLILIETLFHLISNSRDYVRDYKVSESGIVVSGFGNMTLGTLYQQLMKIADFEWVSGQVNSYYPQLSLLYRLHGEFISDLWNQLTEEEQVFAREIDVDFRYSKISPSEYLTRMNSLFGPYGFAF